MPKFRKKPITAEAVQLLATSESILELEQFIEGKENINQKHSMFNDYCNRLIDEGGRNIKTKEGNLRASFGDWVVKGYTEKLGIHFWPVKPDYFLENYEAV